jgi:hypothetical protein
MDDLKFFLGRIHGLENIAYLDDETLNSCNGNPVRL